MNPIRLLVVYYAPTHETRRRVGRLALRDRDILFEYDPEFIATGLPLSPFKLRAQGGVSTGQRHIFDGLMGVFDDSLPDGWGRLLLDRTVQRSGVSPATLTPLDRLAYVGHRGMGALCYEPEMPSDEPTVVNLHDVAKSTRKEIDALDGTELRRLLWLGGSPAGARPKALVQLSRDGKRVIYGGDAIEPDHTAYLVKFPSRNDARDSGPLEHAYALMAAAAGIDVPETRLLYRKKKQPGYFATRRFDRAAARRIHMHTLCGLLHAPHTNTSLSYEDLLSMTRDLTRDESAVAEMYRRACFNVFAHNRDAHSKNFAFLMDEKGQWRPSPAYDLCFSTGPGGEHTLLVAGEGRSPGAEHLLKLASLVDLKRPQPIIDDVQAAVARFRTFAEAAGVSSKTQAKVAKAIGVKKTSGRRR